MYSFLLSRADMLPMHSTPACLGHEVEDRSEMTSASPPPRCSTGRAALNDWEKFPL